MEISNATFSAFGRFPPLRKLCPPLTLNESSIIIRFTTTKSVPIEQKNMMDTLRKVMTFNTLGSFNLSCATQSHDDAEAKAEPSQSSGFMSPMASKSYRGFKDVDVVDASTIPESERLLRKQCNLIIMASMTSTVDINDQCSVAKRNIKVNCLRRGKNFRDLNAASCLRSQSRSRMLKQQASENTRNALLRARKSATTVSQSASEDIHYSRSADGQEVGPTTRYVADLCQLDIVPFQPSVSAGEMDKDRERVMISSSSFICLNRTVVVLLDGSKDCERALKVQNDIMFISPSKVATTLVIDAKQDNLVLIVPWNSCTAAQVSSSVWSTPSISAKKIRLLLKQKLWEAACNIAKGYGAFLEGMRPELDFTILVPDIKGQASKSISTVAGKYMADWIVLPRDTDKREGGCPYGGAKFARYLIQHAGRSQSVECRARVPYGEVLALPEIFKKPPICLVVHGSPDNASIYLEAIGRSFTASQGMGSPCSTPIIPVKALT
ncbi:hypothetical protein PROFUN_06413 [Planoprotostelium fungivorum]|uniref:Uncharacterized protein n=1 Tax=Planoprotostelium fungivorum TaxID=1890364 RepID=A0A2P6NNU4_9EUKA|nr:hypothetical protein PROFUN_06413 [Planoprotostelium fungivorum]